MAGVEDTNTDATALVTGSTSGIGRATALALARLGADVHVHGRNGEKGKEVVAEIQSHGVDSEFHKADFAKQSEVEKLAETIKDKEDLDILVNNAGGYFRNAGANDEGIEFTFAVNHLSHFVLTHELLPVIEDSGDGRVVNVSSEAHKGAKMNLSTVSGDNITGGWRAYGRAKLANIHFTKCLDRRLQDSEMKANVNAIHPGGIPGSGFLRTLPGPIYKLGKQLGRLPFADTPEDGAATILYALFSHEVADISGKYMKDTSTAQPTKLARDKQVQEDLWEKSVELTGTDWSDLFGEITDA